MAYSDFAYCYDDLNAAADYDAVCIHLIDTLRAHGVKGGIVADLGCGTGEVSLRLAGAGYDMLCIDASEDMLAVFREKLEPDNPGSLLLLQQDLAALDLYGTIHAAVCTFDTLNHLAPDALAAAVRRVSLFMEPGGMFLFDANTPYKHQAVLANNSFSFEDDGFRCLWRNEYQPAVPATRVTVEAWEDGARLFREQFLEYEYTLAHWQALLEANGFALLEVTDGESFGPLVDTTQRFAFAAKKVEG